MFKFYTNTIKRSLAICYSITLAMTCVYSYTNATSMICSLIKCDDTVAIPIMRSMFSRIIAIVCFVSRIMVVYKNMNDYPEYKKKIDEYELYFPVNVSKRETLVSFTVIMLFTYIVIILPLNIFRIYLIYYFHSSETKTVLLFLLMYIQNLSICSVEIHFMARCFGLYQKFQSINEEMAMLKFEIMNAYRYPAVLRSEHIDNDCNIGRRPNCDVPFSRVNICGLSNFIELLRMRHQFVRGAFVAFNDLYGIHVGISVFLLFMSILFDIYGEVFKENDQARSQVLIYGWLLQYSFRLCVITLMIHFTTKQVRAITIYVPYRFIRARRKYRIDNPRISYYTTSSHYIH